MCSVIESEPAAHSDSQVIDWLSGVTGSDMYSRIWEFNMFERLLGNKNLFFAPKGIGHKRPCLSEAFTPLLFSDIVSSLLPHTSLGNVLRNAAESST